MAGISRIYHSTRWRLVQARHALAGVPLDGERVSPLWKNDCFYSHLALYRLALPWLRGRSILDVGCGSGYGTAYLAQHGASYVRGMDVDRRTVRFCRRHYGDSGAEFAVGDATALKVEPNRFNAIFCSNVLEHLHDPTVFFRAATQILGEDGMLFLAVPIIDEATHAMNEENPHHYSNLKPQEWDALVRGSFRYVQTGSHHFVPPESGIEFDVYNTPATTRITELDFALSLRVPSTMTWGNTMNVVFLASQRPIKPALAEICTA